MKKFKNAILFIFILGVSFGITACEKPQKEYTKDDFLMGTIISLKYYGENGQKAIDMSIDRIKDIESMMSLNIDDSNINEVNKNAHNKAVKLSDESFDVVEKALEYGSLSKGAFDISIQPVNKLWAIGTLDERVPSSLEIEQGLKSVNYKDIELNHTNKTILFKNSNMEIDLGGIAKGYVADELVKILKENDIVSGIINLGGNLYVYGGKDKNQPLNIGIQDPKGEQGSYAVIVKVKDKSVVTSGNYERYFEVNGTRYHHIIDPKTGYPSNSGLISTTIISDKSIDGDGLSTSTFVMGLDKSLDLINSIPGVEAVFITKDKKVYTTKGLNNENFKINNKEYTYENEKR